MSEKLGEAVLVLRTDDSGLDRGIGGAEGKARALGGTFDKTSASAGRMSGALATTGRAATSAGQQFQRTSAVVTTATNAQRAGFSQLGMQLGDMSTMYALGARPMQIFASQIGQVTQAVQLMTGGTSKFAAFLTGPWGIALIVAVQVLGPFIGKLFETREALRLAETGANGLADAQSALGDVFDLVSGKLKTQNELLLLNARLTAINLRAKAQQQEASSEETFGGFRQGNMGLSMSQKALAALGIPVYGSTGREMAVRDVVRDMDAGLRQANKLPKKEADELRLKVRDEALRRAEKLDFSGLSITAQDLHQAIVDASAAEINKRAAEIIDESLDSGQLAPELRKAGPKPKKPPRDRTAQIANAQAAELARLGEEELKAQLDLTTDAQERADIQRELLARERDERVRQIEADKDLSRAQKNARIAVLDRLYGDPESTQVGPNGEIAVTGDAASPYVRKILRELGEQELAQANDMLSRQAEALGAQAGIAVNLKERDGLERRALALQQEIERNLLEQEIANGRVKDADRARALLAEKQAAVRAQQLRSQQGPMQRYQEAIRATAENMDAEIEAIEVQGLERLNDGLVDAIMGAESLGDVFHKVTRQIIADLLRIAIQQEIIKPIASLLYPGGGFGGGGLFGAVTGLLGGIGGGLGIGGLSLDYSAFQARATGGPVVAGSPYLVGERGPEVIVPDAAGYVIPNHALGAAPGGGRAPAVVELRVTRGEYFDAHVERVSGDVAVRTVQQTAPALVEASAAETTRRLTRPRI